MAKALLGISILIILCAAGLGFASKGKVDLKVAELNSAKRALVTADAAAKSAKSDLELASTKVTEAAASVEEMKTKVSTAETNLTAANAKAEKAVADLAEKDTQIASLNADLVKAKTMTPTEPTENPAMVTLQQQLEKATAESKEAKLAAEQYQSRQKAAEENLVAAQNRIKQYETPIRQQGLTGNVLHVNQGWNFVVIDIGDKQGVTVNSPLLVMRGGQRVATLKITSVEPRQSIADVVPGTMARGTMVQVGDRVVFAGVRGQPNTPLPPAPAGAEAPASPPSPAAPLPNP